MIWFALMMVTFAMILDLRDREIPDWIPVVLVIAGIVAVAGNLTQIGWTRLLIGLILGLVLTYPFFALGGLGGGDVKLVAALGAVLGPAPLLLVLFWTALAGGLLALVAAARKQRDFPYVPAIMVGVLLEALWPGVLADAIIK